MLHFKTVPHVNIKQFKWEKKLNKINETKKLNWLNKQVERETFRGAFFSVLHMLSALNNNFIYIHNVNTQQHQQINAEESMAKK